MRGSLKTVATLGVLALAVATGCTGNSSATGNSSPTGTPARTTPGAPSSTSRAGFTACMVTDIGGLDDKSFNQSSWEGFLVAHQRNARIAIKNLESPAPADYAKNVSAFLAQKCNIIITVGYLMAAVTQKAARENPNQEFAIVDCSYASGCLTKPVLHNIEQLTYNTVQDGFLGGYLAAAMTKTGTVATYGGEEFGTVTIYMDGFWDGVKYYDKQHHKNIKVLGWNEKTQKGTFAGSFTDIATGSQIANSFIRKGADIIFPVAGAVGIGTAETVQAADAAGKHVYMMWVDSDGCVSAPAYCQYFITSVEKGITTSVEGAIMSAFNGTFRGGAHIGTLANGGAVLAPFHQVHVPESVKAELKNLTSKIESGKIVPRTKSPVDP